MSKEKDGIINSLFTEFEQLKSERKELLSRMQTIQGGQSDEGDISTATEEFSLLAGRLDTVAKKIKQVNVALSRVADGTFGICESCGEEIGLKRLEVHPEAPRCIDCAAEKERIEKMTGRGNGHGRRR